MLAEGFVDFPDPRGAPDDEELLAVSKSDIHGREVSPLQPVEWPKLTQYGSRWDTDVILSAYRKGLFPMPFEIDDEPVAIGWWSPQPRAIFLPNALRRTKSLEKSIRNFTTTFDQSFRDVVVACANPERDSGWISSHVIDAYCELHDQGFAHSVEVWNSAGLLVGGLYGLEIGGVFAGESMFHIERDASKVALVRLAEHLDDGNDRIIDSQWMTDHLESLGAIAILRSDYCDLVASKSDIPSAF